MLLSKPSNTCLAGGMLLINSFLKVLTEVEKFSIPQILENELPYTFFK